MGSLPQFLQRYKASVEKIKQPRGSLGLFYLVKVGWVEGVGGLVLSNRETVTIHQCLTCRAEVGEYVGGGSGLDGGIVTSIELKNSVGVAYNNSSGLFRCIPAPHTTGPDSHAGNLVMSGGVGSWGAGWETS